VKQQLSDGERRGKGERHNSKPHLRVLHHELGGEVSVLDTVEDDRETQDEIESSVHPRLVDGHSGGGGKVAARIAVILCYVM
jgi:hypothetical protein